MLTQRIGCNNHRPFILLTSQNSLPIRQNPTARLNVASKNSIPAPQSTIIPPAARRSSWAKMRIPHSIGQSSPG